MLLLVDTCLGIWNCPAGGQATQIFDPEWGNINGKIIGPQDAMMTMRGTFLILHQADDVSFITEWNCKFSSFRVIHEIRPQVKNMELDKTGKLILVLMDDSILHGPAERNAQMKVSFPMSKTGFQITKISTDINNTFFASTIHHQLGACIHYGNGILEPEKYWFDAYWLGDMLDFSLMTNQSIIIATNLTTCIYEYRKIKDGGGGGFHKSDILRLEAKWNFPASNINAVVVSADDTIFASMANGHNERICVWQCLGNTYTRILKGSNQSSDWNHSKTRSYDPIRANPVYDWTKFRFFTPNDMDCFLALRGRFARDIKLPLLAISHIMAAISCHMVSSHLAT
jgi:hypothetical protein